MIVPGTFPSSPIETPGGGETSKWLEVLLKVFDPKKSSNG